MTLRTAFVIAAFVAAFLLAAPAAAAQIGLCMARSALIETLTADGQVPTGERGLATGGVVFEVIAAPDGEWTLLLSRPNGVSCVMAAGEAWESRRPRMSGEKRGT